MTAKIIAIAAVAQNGVIGAAGQLPWLIPEDLAHFRSVTFGHVVLMGRVTFASIPPQNRPLVGRMSLVVTGQDDQGGVDGVTYLPSIEGAITWWREYGHGRTLFVAGGGQVFKATTEYWDGAVVSCLPIVVEGETIFPEMPPKLSKVGSIWLPIAQPLVDEVGRTHTQIEVETYGY